MVKLRISSFWFGTWLTFVAASMDKFIGIYFAQFSQKWRGGREDKHGRQLRLIGSDALRMKRWTAAESLSAALWPGARLVLVRLIPLIQFWNAASCTLCNRQSLKARFVINRLVSLLAFVRLSSAWSALLWWYRKRLQNRVSLLKKLIVAEGCSLSTTATTLPV